MYVVTTMDGLYWYFLPVPSECPVNSTVTGCSTCCCTSSNNVEFYQPSLGEPACTAPAAVYQVRFVATWTAACHPDYYFGSAHWSPLTGISHKPEYELWDACMYDVSPGVALVSQTGNTGKLLHYLHFILHSLHCRSVDVLYLMFGMANFSLFNQCWTKSVVL